MTTIQQLTMLQRDNFLKMVFNMTSHLNEDELDALRQYIFHGSDIEDDYDVRQIMLHTNRVNNNYNSQLTNIPRVDKVINDLDEALLDYEKTVGAAAQAGLVIATKEIQYQWTYVQSVFFTSTIITTVGKNVNLISIGGCHLKFDNRFS